MPLFMQFLTHPMGVYHSIKPSELVTGVSQTQPWKLLTILYEPSRF